MQTCIIIDLFFCLFFLNKFFFNKKLDSDEAGKWQFLGNGKVWQDFPVETCVDIDRLKDSESMTYMIGRRAYTIVKKNSTEAVQENTKTKKKRAIRRVVEEKSSQLVPEKKKEEELANDVNIDNGNNDNNDNSKNNDDSLCIVCFDEKRTHILLPCGHFCLCQGCSQELSECPVCRVQIEKRLAFKLFFYQRQHKPKAGVIENYHMNYISKQKKFSLFTKFTSHSLRPNDIDPKKIFE
ncbi:hypothetical protein RFI_35619 [Reticulomyxa filosa]|uniref:RING-type domain-containing protein n=1 Tax=Reticulomyxa filosa TaxID=46433 RepID=X6LM76_RETFI|nr:hypothetical protein RFI_35619 [Reticulomyxa filosa]|eukprot:ETO01820.1 hypothetical protein RFI_35619 [Reticulomyxa filosa]